MLRLIEKGLMFGGLIEIATPSLVARYNRALLALSGRQTKLESFHIDISGFAPEIGDELDDDLYLNPEGCNRQFILLTPDQATAPLLNAHFSSSRFILKTFYEENADALFALTSRDAVMGELLNSINQITEPAELLNLRSITIDAETPGKHIAKSKALRRDIETFKTSEDGWFDEVLVSKLIDGAGQVGDILRRPLELKTGPYKLGSFHTVHFDGLYHLARGASRCVIGPADAIGKLSDVRDIHCLNIEDSEAVAGYLMRKNYVETVFDADLDEVELLKHRIDSVLAHHFAEREPDWVYRGGANLRAKAYRDLGSLPPLFHQLSDRLRRVEQQAEQKPISPDDPDIFYLLRASRGPTRDVVNMLLASLTPLDPRQLFICHKAAFYKTYASWPPAFRDYVATTLAEDYAPDKKAARARLFGDNEAPRSKAVIGPWGPREGGQ